MEVKAPAAAELGPELESGAIDRFGFDAEDVLVEVAAVELEIQVDRLARGPGRAEQVTGAVALTVESGFIVRHSPRCLAAAGAAAAPQGPAVAPILEGQSCAAVGEVEEAVILVRGAKYIVPPERTGDGQDTVDGDLRVRRPVAVVSGKPQGPARSELETERKGAGEGVLRGRAEGPVDQIEGADVAAADEKGHRLTAGNIEVSRAPQQRCNALEALAAETRDEASCGHTVHLIDDVRGDSRELVGVAADCRIAGGKWAILARIGGQRLLELEPHRQGAGDQPQRPLVHGLVEVNADRIELVETVERTLYRALSIDCAVGERDLQRPPGVDHKLTPVAGDIPVVGPFGEIRASKIEKRGAAVVVEVKAEAGAELKPELGRLGRVGVTEAPGVDLELGDRPLTAIEQIEVLEEKALLEIDLAAEAVLVTVRILPDVGGADVPAPFLGGEWRGRGDTNGYQE